MTTNQAWYEMANVNDVDSPALLMYPDRVEENVRRMIKIAGGANRLCPHVKTHKLAELIRLQLSLGVTRFKCATIAETEMVAAAGASHVTLAHQPVGPKAARLIQLIKQFPKTKFSTIVDDEKVIRELSRLALAAGEKISVFLDIDCGMHRSGIAAGDKAFELYGLLAAQPGLEPAGLHVYDGHIQDADPAVRTPRCEADHAPSIALREKILKAGLLVPRMVVGGTPTFPIHARRANIECSPGTTVLWDAGYGTKILDLDFLHAALVLTRVISKPGDNRLCLDLGHKAIAAENPHPRVLFLNLPEAKAVMHSEEHLVVETSRANEFSPGDCFYGVPWHVCPTVALHSEAVVVRNGSAEGRWKIEARARKLSV
jgi:D-serine deaminase-like pyridoxal phosphate-dependent protein